MIGIQRYYSGFTKDLLPEDYAEKLKVLIEKHKINRNLAACYLVNFEDEYICHRFNGGCKYVRKCRHVRVMETEVEQGKSTDADNQKD